MMALVYSIIPWPWQPEIDFCPHALCTLWVKGLTTKPDSLYSCKSATRCNLTNGHRLKRIRSNSPGLVYALVILSAGRQGWHWTLPPMLYLQVTVRKIPGESDWDFFTVSWEKFFGTKTARLLSSQYLVLLSEFCTRWQMGSFSSFEWYVHN